MFPAPSSWLLKKSVVTIVTCSFFDVSIHEHIKGQSTVSGTAYMSIKNCSVSTVNRRRISATKKEIAPKRILLSPNTLHEYTDQQTL